MNEEKKKKIAQIDELIESRDIPREDVIKHLQSTPTAIKVFSKTVYANIKQGMFWYSDNTFSFDKIPNKKVKAIVEFSEKGIIYGDLTASELFDIPERYMRWESVESFLNEFSYLCEENEKIVWYDIDQLQRVCNNHNAVKNAFNILCKPYRKSMYWSSSEYNEEVAKDINFDNGGRWCDGKYNSFYIRPVLALKVE
jgi:hypothetical protein